ncbi:MAG: redoxin family protein [Gemmatimonadaceae bacterium]|nr:redoxin family protein [Gemmatimonadaceae bacterium]
MNWKRAAMGTAAIAPLVALLAFGMTRNPKEILSPLPGRAAPDFALAVMPMDVTDGAPEPASTDTVRLADRRGRIQVVNYYASWCLACRDEHPVLSALAPRYAARGVDFVGIVYKDSPSAMRRWIVQMGGQTYPALLDPSARSAIDYGLYGVPETVFIGADGRVVKKYIGPVTHQVLTSTLDSLIALAPAPPVQPVPADTVVR